MSDLPNTDTRTSDKDRQPDRKVGNTCPCCGQRRDSRSSMLQDRFLIARRFDQIPDWVLGGG
jgi:hypothetical protein